MSKTWDELIAEGEQLKIMEERVEAEAGNIRWLWGDLALEVAPVGPDHKNNGAMERLERFAEALDVSPASLRQYRHVANAWPHVMRVTSQPWVVHQQIASREDREELIANPVDVRTGEKVDRWTFRGMQRFLGQKPSPHYQAPPSSVEEKAEVVRAFLEEAGVAQAALAEAGPALAAVRDALDDRSEKYNLNPGPVPEKSFDDRCTSWVMRLNGIMMEGAKLASEAEQVGHSSDTATSHLAVMLYQRLSERQFDAEIRRLLETEGA